MGRGGVERRAWTSHSAEETAAIGGVIGKELPEGTILALFGDLGAGKTTLIKGLIAALTGTPEEEICSPTFVYMQDYADRVVHYDLYRIETPDQFIALGLDEPLGSSAVCCIEWADRIEKILPPETVRLTISHAEGGRSIVMEGA